MHHNMVHGNILKNRLNRLELFVNKFADKSGKLEEKFLLTDDDLTLLQILCESNVNEASIATVDADKSCSVIDNSWIVLLRSICSNELHQNVLSYMYQIIKNEPSDEHNQEKLCKYDTFSRVFDFTFIKQEQIQYKSNVNASSTATVDTDKSVSVIDNSWIVLLRSMRSSELYQDALSYLHPVIKKETSDNLNKEKDNKEKLCKYDTFSSEIDLSFIKQDLKLKIYKNMLFQFSIIAMFIGIFLQLIFKEKSVTEPV